MASIPELESVYENTDRCILQEKFLLIKVSDNVFKGKYPLEPYMEGARGTYGGEVLTQSAIAAYATMENPEFQMNSCHAYFVRAGSSESCIRYEVVTNSSGKSFVNKTVHAYQEHTNELIFEFICSFAFNNSIKQREEDYESGKSHRIPVKTQSTPSKIFKKYRNDVLEDLKRIVKLPHTHGLVEHSLPRFFMKNSREKDLKTPFSDRRMGFFGRITDQLPSDPVLKQTFKVAGLLYLSDSLYLGSIGRTFGHAMTGKSADFFRTSLDHAVYFHDTDFDPTQHLFIDYKFVRMSNSRVLCFVMFFDLNGKQVATVTQEGLIDLRPEVKESYVKREWKL